MAKIKIIYGSGGGNTEVVCEKVEQVLRDLGHEVSLLKAKVTEPEDIGESDLLVFASPTYGHGLLEQYMGKFMEKMKDFDLKGRRCGIIGLGDPKYDQDYHIESIKILHDFLTEKGAEIFYMPLRISRSPYPLLNTHAARWAEKIDEKLK